MSDPLLVSFAAGPSGTWRIDRIDAVMGKSLPEAEWLKVTVGDQNSRPHSQWVLRGVTSNARYATRGELDALAARQEAPGRSTDTCAALIPIRKSQAWWDLAQDERREIFETKSRHIGIGLEYLPAIARRLHHSRELGEPFDFLTWFEYTPEHAEDFDELVRRLRQTAEWRYVEREVDIRLSLRSPKAGR